MVRTSARLYVGFMFFCEDLLQDDLIQGQIRHQLLQSVVLFLQLSRSPIFGDCHLAVAFPPDVVGRFTDHELACHLQHWCPCACLVQGRRVLLLGKRALLYTVPP